MSEQLKLDFVRGEQVQMLRDCRLPPVVCADGKPVSNAAMKSILFAIDSRAGKGGTCWASVDSLMQDSGLGRRTVLRALEGLRRHCILIESPDENNSRIVHRRIAWANLKDFRIARGTAPARAELVAPLSATNDEIGATNDEIGATNDEIGATITPIGATVAPKASIKHGGREHIKNSMEGAVAKSDTPGMGGVSEMDRGGDRAPTGWTLRADLRASDLRDGRTVAELWRSALEAGLLPDTAFWRETFAGLCFSLWRQRSRMRNPVGMLHHKLRSGPNAVLAQVDDEHDRAWAKALLRELDGEPVSQPTAPTDVAMPEADKSGLEARYGPARRSG